MSGQSGGNKSDLLVMVAVSPHSLDRTIFHVPRVDDGAPACGTRARMLEPQPRRPGWFICRGCERYADRHYPGWEHPGRYGTEANT